MVYLDILLAYVYVFVSAERNLEALLLADVVFTTYHQFFPSLFWGARFLKKISSLKNLFLLLLKNKDSLNASRRIQNTDHFLTTVYIKNNLVLSR